MLWLHTECQRHEPKEKIFSFFFFKKKFCGGGFCLALLLGSNCVCKKNQTKYWKGRLFHAEVTSFNKEKLVLKHEFRYMLSPLHSVAIVTSVVEVNLLGLDMSGGPTPAKPLDTCSWEQVRVGRKLTKLSYWRWKVLREHEIRPSDGDNHYDDPRTIVCAYKQLCMTEFMVLSCLGH